MSLRREIPLYSLLLGMELLGAFAALVAIGAPRMTAAGYGLFWLLLLAAMTAGATALLVEAAPWRDPAQRGAVLLAGFAVCTGLTLAVAGGRNSIITTGVVLAFAFWRGVVVTQAPPNHDEARRRFGYGFGLLFLGIVWIVVWGVALDHAIWQMLAVVGIAYTLVGMIALAIARLESDRDPTVGTAVSFTVAALVGALFFVALIALQIFSLDVVDWAAQILEPISTSIGHVGGPVIQVLLSPIFWLVGIVHHQAPAFHAHGEVPLRRRSHRRVARHAVATGFPAVIDYGLLALLLAVSLFLLWRLMPLPERRRRHRASLGNESHSTLSGPSGWLGAFLTWLRQLFSRGSTNAMAGVQRLREQVLGSSQPADPVRRAYSQILRQAKSAGESRAASVTPLEFQKQLQARWPIGTHDFATLTDAYILRRYGETEISDAQEHEMESCRQRVRTVMK